MQGKIKSLGSKSDPAAGFGFILPDDGTADAFFPFSAIVEGKEMLGKGSEVEFEYDEPGKKGPKARDVRVLTQGRTAQPHPKDASTDPANPSASAPTATAPAKPQPDFHFVEGVVAGIELAFSDPHLLIYFQTNYGGVDVTLLVDGDETETGMTDFEGRTEFALEIPADAQKRVIEIIVANGTVPYRKIWLRNPAAEASAEAEIAPEPSAPPNLEVRKTNQTGNLYRFEVLTNPNAGVTIESSFPICVRLEIEDDSAWVKGSRIIKTADIAGRLLLAIKAATAGTKGEINFVAGGLKQGPFYVTSRRGSHD